MSTELKPCPFCGSTNLSTEDARDFVSCGDCYTEGPCNPGQGSAANIEAWNRRALSALSAQPPAPSVPTGFLCRTKAQVRDADKAFPGEPHDYLWKYTHGTKDLADLDGCDDHFEIIRLYAEAPTAIPAPPPVPSVQQVRERLTDEQIMEAVPDGIVDCLLDPWDQGKGDNDTTRSIRADIIRIARAIERALIGGEG